MTLKTLRRVKKKYHDLKWRTWKVERWCEWVNVEVVVETERFGQKSYVVSKHQITIWITRSN